MIRWYSGVSQLGGFETSALVPQANFPIRLSSDKGDMHVPKLHEVTKAFAQAKLGQMPY